MRLKRYALLFSKRDKIQLLMIRPYEDMGDFQKAANDNLYKGMRII